MSAALERSHVGKDATFQWLAFKAHYYVKQSIAPSQRGTKTEGNEPNLSKIHSSKIHPKSSPGILLSISFNHMHEWRAYSAIDHDG